MADAKKGFVKFTQTRTTKEAEPKTFEAGTIYELPRASVDRWVGRGVAEEVSADDFKAQESAKRNRKAAPTGGGSGAPAGQGGAGPSEGAGAGAGGGQGKP